MFFQLPAGVYLSLINTYAQVTNREASSQARPAWERNPLGQQNTWPRIESPSEESPTTNGTISVVSFDVLTGMLGEFFECQAYISSPISHIYPTGSMYGIFTYIYHTKQPNVGKYTSPMDPMGIN